MRSCEITKENVIKVVHTSKYINNKKREKALPNGGAALATGVCVKLQSSREQVKSNLHFG